MINLLFCCFMKSAQEPIERTIIPPAMPTKYRVEYRPYSIQPFTPQELEYFRSLEIKHVATSGN